MTETASLHLPVDGDPRARRIADLRREVAEQQRVIGILVRQLGGNVVIRDVDLAEPAILYYAESRAEGGWRLWVKAEDPSAVTTPEGPS